MKSLLLATAAALTFAGAAQAQVSFVKGQASLSFGAFSTADDDLQSEVIGRAAFEVGNFGFQLGGELFFFNAARTSIDFTSYDLRAYRKTANGNKFGAYIGNNGIILGFGDDASPVYGAEAMLGFGAVDVEISVGSLGISSIVDASLNVYFDVTDNIEISASYITYFGDTIEFDLFGVGAAYQFGNSGYSAFVNYATTSTASVQSINIGLSWEFGPNTNERFFSKRGVNILTLDGAT